MVLDPCDGVCAQLAYKSRVNGPHLAACRRIRVNSKPFRHELVDKDELVCPPFVDRRHAVAASQAVTEKTSDVGPIGRRSTAQEMQLLPKGEAAGQTRAVCSLCNGEIDSASQRRCGFKTECLKPSSNRLRFCSVAAIASAPPAQVARHLACGTLSSELPAPFGSGRASLFLAPYFYPAPQPIDDWGSGSPRAWLWGHKGNIVTGRGGASRPLWSCRLDGDTEKR